MKKFIIALVVVAIVAFLIYWLTGKPKDTTENKEPVPLTVNNVSDAFQASFTNLMSTYYSLRDGFVNWDTVAVNKAALDIQAKADGLPMQELKADSSIVETAKSFSQSVTAEAKGILGENNIEQKRRSFYTLSEHLYNLVRTVRYKGEVIYHQHCPMAFNDDEEAYWLSNSDKIVNPYLGT
ncbi:MAG: DUF3347 domain-containing protein, partial [Chitinophagaceae bacterium]